jgi:hypothetical protein
MIVMFSLELYTPEYKQYADDIGFYAQACGGYFHVARYDVEFTFPQKYKTFVMIKYPFLKEIALCY